MYKAILLLGLAVHGLSGQTLTTIVSFNGLNGAGPITPLLGADGNYYGVTGSGGSGYGTIYRLTQSGSLTTLYNFRAADSGFPATGLVQASDGSFYGTTGVRRGYYGGVFRVTASGVFTVLHTFSYNGCYSPNTPLIEASDGSLYGTTAFGGSGGCIYRITTSGALTIVHSLAGNEGSDLAGLVQGSDGNFYGATATGGPSNAGTIFKMTPAGVLTTIHTFTISDGRAPLGALRASTDGNFFGVTSAGGSSDNGTVYKITPVGALTTLHSFSGAEGFGPRGTLIRAGDGNLYGATQYGGLNSLGTIFRLTTTGELTNIHNFASVDGAFPAGGLIQGADGNIYGAGAEGGKYGYGLLFKMTLAGVAQPPTVSGAAATLVTDSSATLTATVTANGADTQSWFSYGTDSSLTGAVSTFHQGMGSTTEGVTLTVPLSRLSPNTTYYFRASASNAAGAGSSPIASFTTTTYSTYSIFGTVSFAGKGLAGVNVVLDGSQGQSGPTGDSGFFGFSPGAGGNYTVTPIASGYTFVPPSASFLNLNTDQMVNFTAVAAGPPPDLTTLTIFDGSNGAYPRGLIQARDGNFYGATAAGGNGGQGTLFQLTPGGVLTSLRSFSGSDGTVPAGPPVQAADGNLYGMTTRGGTGAAGTVYQLTSAGGFTTLASFDGPGGPPPYDSLIQATDGNFYGTTMGDPFNLPAAFRMTPGGQLTTLTTFTQVVGDGPYSGLLQATDGNFYGSFYGASGFASRPGLIFKMTPAGSVTAMYVFCALANCADGTSPEQALIEGAEHNFYGVASRGGNNRAGVAFKLTPAGTLTVLHSFSLADGTGPGRLLLARDGNFYGVTSGGGASYGGTIFRLTPAGAFTTLHHFNTTDGASPQGSLIQGADGNLYGVTANGGAYDKGTIFRLTLPKTGPIVNPTAGVVSAASFQAGIAGGSWITILGSNLSPQIDNWSNSIVNGVLPQSLDGVTVKVGNQPAYIAYISPGQINALAPELSPGDVTVSVTSANGASAPITATALTWQPSFFQWGQYAVATRVDYSDAVKDGAIPGLSTLPAKPGETIVLWGTGFGPTAPPVPQGVEVPTSTAYYTASPVTVKIGGAPATVFGAALTPRAAGLYQIAIQIPAGLSDGEYPVVASIAGVQSPTGVLITVQH